MATLTVLAMSKQQSEPPAKEPSHQSIPYEIRDTRLQPSPRNGLIHVPSSYSDSEPVPLIIALHGKGQPPKEFEYHTQLSNEETNQDAIVVYPEGIKV